MSALQRLTLRERVLLALCGALIVVAGLWFYAWQPLAAERVQQEQRISRYLGVMRAARQAGDAAVPLRVAPSFDQPLAARVTQSAEAAGIPLARLDPEGARLRITVARAPFAVLVAWIAALEDEGGAEVVSLEMSRLTEPGVVSLRLTVEETG
jgi:general secretion pathway protein M